MMEKIDWRKLDNYPGYSISSDGQVRSDSRILWNGKGFFRSKEKLLKPNTLAKGYYQVELKVGKIGLNVHSPKSGKPKRAIKLIDKKTREELSFESIAQAVSFLGKSCGANLMKVLKDYPHYNTIKGYYAKYI